MEPPPRMGVYTILTESRYLRIRNVPNIADISGELELICQQFAPILTFTPCPQDPLAEIYTQTFLLSTTTYLEAKKIKKGLDDCYFYSFQLYVSYMPELESLSELREKLDLWRSARNVEKSNDVQLLRKRTDKVANKGEKKRRRI